MSKILNTLWQYLRAFVLIYACLYAGIFVASLLPITIPGSIIGMLILFVLLALQILPARWVNPGCYVLIRYMALLFVPIGVGVMQYFTLLQAQFGPVVISCATSTLIVFLVVSWSSHLVHGERKVIGKKGAQK
ncbi:holin-like protein [Enterobacter sp. BIGb0383]|uniref:CidA/LrgA family protein n=1 Tax=unclassified Enterobacter TaxID=2608935 RepID=UPI000F495368|nr:MULTISPECIES: CidA/LrgA family protein [unclassified Enterobacter]ROP62802.1 holin-like protein [Enterobacter sp. BIGb0383]ROS12963.1 holin-like protein [Enterobacter sp. BIGb0359]